MEKLLQKLFSCQEISRPELIQKLWSGYGRIDRYFLKDAEIKSIIVKEIDLHRIRSHPRGWNTEISHQRKVKSYQVEQNWYTQKSTLYNSNCKFPKCYYTSNEGKRQIIILEDLDAIGFSERRGSLTVEESKLGLKWLAHFHALYLNQDMDGLWEKGTYWHLETRPDEYKQMKAGSLKKAAKKIDSRLNHAKFQTVLHGDAKVANFCFNAAMDDLAAVDFQYTGNGCGMKDVAYFLGSCLTEMQLETFEKELLAFYFKELKTGLIAKDSEFNFDEMEQEWRSLYPYAWADFTRFLMGWMPSHPKLNAYSNKMVEKALLDLEALN